MGVLYCKPLARHVCGTVMLICIRCKSFFCPLCDTVNGERMNSFSRCCKDAVTQYREENYKLMVSNVEITEIK